MVRSRQEDSTKSQSTEIQKLNVRVEEMAAMFTADLNQFKKDLLGTKKRSKSTSTSSDVDTSVTSLIERFSEFEQFVHNTLCAIKSDITNLQKVCTRQTNYIHQNSIVIHGLSEGENNNIYESFQHIVTATIGIPIIKSDINFCQRMGPVNKNDTKPRPVLVNFCRRWLRDEIFVNKKKLKGTKWLVTEYLNVDSLKLYKSARNHFKNACWTFGGRVFVFSKDKKLLVESEASLQDIVAQDLVIIE